MKKVLSIILSSLSVVMCAAGHTENSTEWDPSMSQAYAKLRHGPDGALLLDPYFIPELENVNGQVVLDAGCGAGPWGIVAAQNGATVYGVDIQDCMIEKAKESAESAGVSGSTTFEAGDVTDLPYPDGFFDKALSLLVGCNLRDLEPHIRELGRVLKKGGVAVVTAPISFGEVFTDGKRPQNEVVRAIRKLLIHQNAFPKSMEVLSDVYRATFAKRSSRWILVHDERMLMSGEEIWRKIPGLIVPNHYHSKEEYLTLFRQEGFEPKEVYSTHFSSEEDRLIYNKDHKETFGKEYVSNSPFVIMILEKN